MIPLFGQWIKNIALFVIFSAFIEMLMPENSFKKYIHMMMGLILMLILIRPITALVFDNNTFENLVKLNQIEMERQSIIKQRDMISSKQDGMIMDAYKEKLCEQITKLISSKEDVDIKYIEVFVNEDKDQDSFGAINKINMVIANKDTSSKDKVDIEPIEPIKPINISADKNKKTDAADNTHKKPTALEKNIKNLLINFYNLSGDNIHITVQKKS